MTGITQLFLRAADKAELDAVLAQLPQESLEVDEIGTIQHFSHMEGDQAVWHPPIPGYHANALVRYEVTPEIDAILAPIRIPEPAIPAQRFMGHD